MSNRDPRVDAYIAKSADFAKPILTYIRDVVHTAVPDVEETMKWSTPSFDYHGPLCAMAAFKEHCRLVFWKGSLIGAEFERITTTKDLPSKKELAALVKKAAQLNEQGIKLPRPKRASKAAVETPADLASALRKNKKAASMFENFSPSHRREYVEWITDAKSDETRQRRVSQAVEWMAEGKPRNWKYMKT